MITPSKAELLMKHFSVSEGEELTFDQNGVLRNVSWVRPPSSNTGFSDSTEVAGTQTRLGRSEPKSGECRLRSCIFRVMHSPQASLEPASMSLSTVAARRTVMGA